MSYETPLEIINERLELLHNVLVFDSEVSKRFKIGERILINQERGSLYDIINFIGGHIEKEQVRILKVSEQIEVKIQAAAIDCKLEYIKQIEVINPTILKKE